MPRGRGWCACAGTVILFAAGCAERVIFMEGIAGGTTELGAASSGSPVADTGSGDAPQTETGGSSDAEAASGDGCEARDLEPEPVPPDVMLVLDQSFSMNRPLSGETTRWDAVYQALFDEVRGVAYRSEGARLFGMTLYTTSFERGVPGPPEECPRLRGAEPSWFAPAAELAAVYASQSPLGHTPTGEALTRVVEDLSALPSDNAKVIVLSTDGEPDTCADGFTDNGQLPAVEATQFAFSRGVRVYVVSVGEGVDVEHLQHLANAGVGKATTDSDTAPFAIALSVSELRRAYTAILDAAPPCAFDLSHEVDIDRQCEGEVVLDGSSLRCGVEWTLVSPTRLLLLGDTCVGPRSEVPEIEVTWPCDLVGATY